MNTLDKNLLTALVKRTSHWILWIVLLIVKLCFWGYILYLSNNRFSFKDESNNLYLFTIIMLYLYLLLLPIPDLVFFAFVKIKAARKKPFSETPMRKTENRHLMGFYNTAPSVIPWPVFCTISGACFLFLIREYQICVLLFIWLLLQILEGKLASRNDCLERKKELRNDVLSLYENEKNGIEKSLHYAIIMADDSQIIPSTFGNGNYPVNNILLFDHTTEIEPFLAENQDKNFAENWGALYMCSDFFIYAFDSIKYTIEELEQKCFYAISYSRFQVSKPVYILISNFSAKVDQLIQKYAWLPEVSIRLYRSWDQLRIQEIVDDYTNKNHISAYKDMDQDMDYAEELGHLGERLSINAPIEYIPTMKTGLFSALIYGKDSLKYNYWNHMSSFCQYLMTPLEKLECKDWDYFYHYMNTQTKQIFYYIQGGQLTFYHQVSNFYVCGFFNNIFRWKEIDIAVMIEFEYAHLALRFVYYYLFSKRKPGPIEKYFKEDKELGEAIFELAEPDDMLYPFLHKKMDTSDPLLHNALLILKELFGIEQKEESLDFLHLTNIIRICRNITRGHGAIRYGIQNQIWFSMYVLLTLLNDMLCIGSMEIRIDEDEVNVSYVEDEYWYKDKRYAIVENHVPLLLHGIVKKKQFQYINYYRGSASVPEIVVHIWNDEE